MSMRSNTQVRFHGKFNWNTYALGNATASSWAPFGPIRLNPKSKCRSVELHDVIWHIWWDGAGDRVRGMDWAQGGQRFMHHDCCLAYHCDIALARFFMPTVPRKLLHRFKEVSEEEASCSVNGKMSTSLISLLDNARLVSAVL